MNAFFGHAAHGADEFRHAGIERGGLRPDQLRNVSATGPGQSGMPANDPEWSRLKERTTLPSSAKLCGCLCATIASRTGGFDVTTTTPSRVWANRITPRVTKFFRDPPPRHYPTHFSTKTKAPDAVCMGLFHVMVSGGLVTAKTRCAPE